MGIYIRNISIKIVFLILFFFPVLNTISQEADNANINENENSTLPEEISLFEKTIALDIETADYYELVAWTRQLGIDTKGTKKELQQRLLSHYKKEEKVKAAKESKNLFIIESAERSEYFNIEKIDEDYIKISGNVVIRIENNEDGTTHSIKTDKIIFNQKNNLMTAEGNVTYSRKKNDEEEIFNGKKLSFNISNWEGIFIESGSEQTSKQDDGSELKFIYSGEKIYKDNDVIIIDNAEITSSNPDAPYYSIRAKRVWVLAPSEWGLKNAVLYVGHVPMFYFPFFFNPGDTLVFNPAFGVKQPIGYFMQTTTYLFGTPKKENDAALFSISSDSDNTEYETEVRGIYLRKIKKKENPTPSDQFIKIMFDIYSRLGLFAGAEGKTSVLNFYAGIAKSRNIYAGKSSMYSTFFENSDGEFTSDWNKGNFMDNSFPFRFGLELDTKNSFKNLQYDLSLDFYSDPYFPRDFNERSELTDWSKLLGIEDEKVDKNVNTNTMDRLWWYFHGSYRYPNKILGGAISEINITKFDFSMNWRNKKQPDIGFPGTDPSLPGYVPFSSRTDYFYPEQYFYYPEYYKFPDVSFAIKGNIFSKTLKRSSKNIEQPAGGGQKPSEDLISPWKKEKEDTEKEDKDNTDLSILEYQKMQDENIKAFKNRELFYHSMSYNISPNVSVTETMDHTTWQAPEAVSFKQAYTETRTYGRADILYNAKLYDDLLSIDNNIILTGDYRSHSNKSDTISDTAWNNYLLQDYKATYLKIENSSTVTTFPLYKYEMYDQSFIKYQADIITYKKEFDQLDSNSNPNYSNSYFAFEKEYFTRHETETHLKYYSWWNQMQQFRIRAIHPPLLQRIENENIIRTGPLTSTTIFVVNEERKDVWVPGDLTLRERLAYDNKTYIEHTLIYDGYSDEWNTSQTVGRISFLYDEIYFMNDFKYGFKVNSPLEFTSTLNLWFFQAQYKARRQFPATYVTDYGGWMLDTKEKFVPSEFLAKIDFSRYFMPIWKNRIRYKTNLLTTWKMDLQEFTENALIFDLGFDFRIHQFLNINFNIKSENNSTYRYIPSLAKELGEEWVNPVTDLLKSFNFFNIDDRYESFFKLKQLDFKIVHHLGDWDISVQYTGFPDFFQPATGLPEWKWKSEATLMIQWNPIKQLKTEVKMTSDDGFTM